jgi:hypothetical protein
MNVRQTARKPTDLAKNSSPCRKGPLPAGKTNLPPEKVFFPQKILQSAGKTIFLPGKPFYCRKKPGSTGKAIFLPEKAFFRQ